MERALFCAALLVIVRSSAAEEAARRTPAPRAPTRTPARRLFLDVDRHVEKVLAKDDETPRFETSVDVFGRSPQETLDRQFRKLDLECGPSWGVAPTLFDMRSEGGLRAAPLNLLGMSQMLLAGALLKPRNRPDRYFIYRVTRADEVRYELHEGRLAPSALYAPGTMYEVVDAFADLDDALRALRRRERGLPRRPEGWAPAPAPWATTACRPKKD